MDGRLCVSFLLVLCHCFSGVEGVLDSCTTAVSSCLNKGKQLIEREDCLMFATCLRCIDGTRDVCQLEETHVTYHNLASAYTWTCNEIRSQVMSVKGCQAAESCVKNTDNRKTFNATDPGKRQRIISEAAVKTEFWCRLWVQSVECYIHTAKTCYQSDEDIEKVTGILDLFKAVCNMRAAKPENGDDEVTTISMVKKDGEEVMSPNAYAQLTANPCDDDSSDRTIAIASVGVGLVTLVFGIFIGFVIAMRRRGQKSGDKTDDMKLTATHRQDLNEDLYLTPCAPCNAPQGESNRLGIGEGGLFFLNVTNPEVDSLTYTSNRQLNTAVDHIYEMVK